MTVSPCHLLPLAAHWKALCTLAEMPPSPPSTPYGVPPAWHAVADRVARIDRAIDRWVEGELRAMEKVAGECLAVAI